MRPIWVNIDLRKLALRLCQSHGRPMADDDLRQWLSHANFVHVRGAWFLCHNTDHLFADEIIEMMVRETTQGITFIHRQRRDPQRL